MILSLIREISMNAFIKAAEIWVPNHTESDRSSHLHAAASYYGELGHFAEISATMTFGYGEGLPGSAWQCGHPVLWSDLRSDRFKRSNFISDTGIDSGLAIPIFAGDFLQAVVVLFCGNPGTASGAVEIWQNDTQSPQQLNLMDGYYGVLEQFAAISRNMTIQQGESLPGKAWQLDQPLLLQNLANRHCFIRAHPAEECGLATGLALPYIDNHRNGHVVCLLSTLGTPIASQYEVWLPDGNQLKFHDGFAIDGSDLHQRYDGDQIERGEGQLGKVWLSGVPHLASRNLTAPILCLPVINAGRLSGIVRLVL
jgi:hypothetical protein|tara:strand:+ start:16777 stop:17709 length:933 start_codon:yes stop_codon:yes gene_type:complete